MNIVPAVLTPDPEELRQMLERARSFARRVQIDIMDGKFVPSKSIAAAQLREAGPSPDLEVHLMVLRPEEYLEPFREAGARRVVFHYEAAEHPEKVLSRARDLGLSPGIALNPETPASRIEPLLEQLDFVLFLSVNPGFYGSPFIPEAADKLYRFKCAHPRVEAGLDGGIKAWNLRRLRAFGVDYACIGSAIFRGDPAENYRRLSRLLLRSPAPELRPLSPEEKPLFRLLCYLRHTPETPDWEEQDRLVLGPEFEEGLSRLLPAFGYSGAPPWAETTAHPLGRARDLALLAKQRERDILVCALCSPEYLQSPRARDTAGTVAELGLDNLRLIVPGPLSEWTPTGWEVISTPSLEEALDRAQRCWGRPALILLPQEG